VRNIQPMFAELEGGGIALAHNGNLTNSRILREELVREGAIFQSTSDTEVIVHLMARSREVTLPERIADALRHV
jgi:amidophosphoribosyltransferase